MRIFRTATVYSILTLCIILSVPPLPVGAVSVEIGPVELDLYPGDEYFGSIRVWNNESEPIDIRIYPGDWLQTVDGEQFLEVGEVSNSMTEWMLVTPSQLTIPPGGSEDIYFEIKVPDDPTLTGSYWGIFFVEGMPKPSADNPPVTDAPTLGIKIILRHGIKVYVTIPGTEQKQAKFTTARTFVPETGGLDFIATLENLGNTYLRPEVWLEIRDIGGITLYTESHRTITLLPEVERDYKFELRDLNIPPGRYIALIIADYGAQSLVAAQAEIEVKED